MIQRSFGIEEEPTVTNAVTVATRPWTAVPTEQSGNVYENKGSRLEEMRLNLECL